MRQLLVDGAKRAGVSAIRVAAEEMRIGEPTVSAHGTRFRIAALGDEAEVETPLIGRHQAANFAFTLALLDAAGDPFRVSLREAVHSVRDVRLPGRFQRVGKWIFDVAHNADGIRTLAGSLASITTERPIAAVLCVLGDKEWRAMIELLAPAVDSLVLTNAPTAPASRAWSLADAVAHAHSLGIRAHAEADFDAALSRADRESATSLHAATKGAPPA